MHTTQHGLQQINQCRQIAVLLIQQTQQGNQMYQQMLHQEQQNVHMLEQLLHRERQAVQTIQQSIHGHEMAIQRCQQVINLCDQMEHQLTSLQSFNTNVQTNFIPNINTMSQMPSYRTNF